MPLNPTVPRPPDGGHGSVPTVREVGGIYIHVPFCVRKCLYCDFYSEIDRSRIPDYLDALDQEIRCADPPAGLIFDTLYIGGGTPSVLASNQVNRIMATVRERFELCPDAEITLEANPGTLTEKGLRALRRLGVNRLNIGVQSFSDKGLRFLGRVHSAEDARTSVRWAQDAGYDSIGLDLIYGLPGQSAADWIADMTAAVTLAPHHLSCYMLTYEPRTPLSRLLEKRTFKPLSESRVGTLFQTTIRFLADHGYTQYEVSNFARSSDKQSRHNRKYWSMAPYLGFGPSAHSFMPPERWWNVGSIGRYMELTATGQPVVDAKEVVDREGQIIEGLYLGLRQTDGIRIPDFENRFELRFKEVFGEVLATLRKKKWLQDAADRCALTPLGLRFLDSVTSMFVSRDFSGIPTSERR
ncbi:radical SAM family heme chaperone HemW [Desulfococcus sp.]|uniref:radical SAM family heme chaperone HemW n=1 Tax=Desulfococcus sp. TaxID=2025834 RepID=UPI003D13833B